MFTISKTLISEFEKEINHNSFDNALNNISYALNIAMERITSQNPLVSAYSMGLANEALSVAAIPSSSIDIFLYLDAVQLELNFLQKKNNTFKTYILNFAKSFKENFRLFKRKIKQKKLEKLENKNAEAQNYNILNFYKDLQFKLAKNLYKDTTIAVLKNCIKVIGKEEFGIEINIYPVFSKGDDFYLYNLNNKKSIKIDFKDRFKNMTILNKLTNGQYFNQVKIFNNIYWNLFKQTPNQIFIESLLFNVPVELFSDDGYKTTVCIINYLKNSTMQNFISVCDNTINIFKENLNIVNLENAIRFIKLIKIDC